MSTVFESVAAARPRIHRDVLFTAAHDGVLFHNSGGGFKITSPSAYRLASLLVPVLDGRRTVAELCAKLPDPQRAMVGELVSALLSRSFARDVPTDEVDPATVLGAAVAKRFASQIGYLDHYAAGAPRRFAAFRDSTAVVVGSGPIAHMCAVSLIRNGMARVAIVGDSDGAAAAEAAELDATGVPSAVLDWRPAGDEPTWADLAGADIVLVAGGDGAARLTHRLLAAGVPEGKTLVPAWTFGRWAIVGPAGGTDRRGCWYCAMLRLSANDSTPAAAEVWRGVAVAGAPPAGPAGPTGPLASMIGNLLAFEVFRLTTGALPAETDGKVTVQDLESLDVVSEQLSPHPRCVYCRQEPTPIALDAAALDAAPQQPPGPDAATDAAAAQLSARDGLVQPHTGIFRRYDDEDWDQTPVKIGTVLLTDPAGRRRRVSAFDVHHVVGARTRALARAAVAYADQLGAGAGSVGAVTGTSLVTGRPVEVRRAAVEPFGTANADRLVEPTAAGAGAGFDPAAAVRDGLASALAFVALRGAIAGALPSRVPLDTCDDDAELRFLTRSAANLGTTVELLDLGASVPAGVHALLARCTEPRSGEKLWTIAADPSWRTAAVRALCDLVGQVQLRQQSTDPQATDGTDPVLVDYHPDTLAVAGTAAARTAADGRWQQVLAGLAEAGTDVVLVPIGGSDLPAGGLFTVRVVLQERSRG
ncbi:bacteriocin biosynthesis cyclodehydratase domain-containing protein [Micromonospora matsumotoense]|uniref:Bacteriocin biosynthesis cyclodehydratase domain-containing protein n=1 Tax=Micromonospora matsumotoense TaxID=121616 RepID=A0A1C4Z769_9ACTN|nr:TOMM precursor leader peptide-binding protein [Micromonospora matsumotoense]SCF28803.1 bacteriocin biosynthesis cyclodehydratase domain-containing protein [Micromonospora matsumotoense]